MAHHGEAEHTREGFLRSSEYERNSLIEFLKTLQVLPPGTRSRVVDQQFKDKKRSLPQNNNRVWEATSFLGVPCQKSVSDLWNYQEILTTLKPRLLVELTLLN